MRVPSRIVGRRMDSHHRRVLAVRSLAATVHAKLNRPLAEPPNYRMQRSSPQCFALTGQDETTNRLYVESITYR